MFIEPDTWETKPIAKQVEEAFSKDDWTRLLVLLTCIRNNYRDTRGDAVNIKRMATPLRKKVKSFIDAQA